MIDVKTFLEYVDLMDLHQKICDFRNLDFKKLSYQEIQNEISNVVKFNSPFGQISVLIPTQSTCQIGTRFYRIRKISGGGSFTPVWNLSKISDCWEPPVEAVGIGRLNKINEPLLYTSLGDPEIALEEMKINNDEFFTLFVYEAVEQINLTLIGKTPDLQEFSKEQILKIRMIQDFLGHEFTRDVGIGTEFLYKISESIAKDYFDLPPWTQDAWCYPSVAKKGGYNVCFRPITKSKLKLVGALFVASRRDDEGFMILLKSVAKESADGVSLEHYDVKHFKDINDFPEFKF